MMAVRENKSVLIAVLLGAGACSSLFGHEQGHTGLSVSDRLEHAIELLQAKQVHASVELLNSLADLGDRAAQFELYRLSIDEPANTNADEPALLLRRAAGPASAQAQLMLAQSCLNGIDREPDPALAAYWMQRAANQGHQLAQVLLAGMLERGDGIQADPQQASLWMARAAANGSSEAAFRLGKTRSGTAGRSMIESAAGAGHSGARRYLGLQLARGGAYPTDEPAALNWLTLSAESGDPTAMLLVGLFHLQGRGTAVDANLAYQWLKRAQINGQTDAIAHVMKLEKSMQLGSKVSAMTAAMADILPDPLPLSGIEPGFPANQLLGHGSAFWVNQAGYLLTNYHVVERCSELRISGVGIARLVASEPQNDIAVLLAEYQPDQWAKFAGGPGPRLGMQLNTYTIEHAGSEFEQVQVHRGTIKALTRPDHDARYFRFDSRLEAGSSGAPVLDDKGEVLGMVVAKLAPAAAYELTGTATEAVSFALHPALIREFLDIYAIEHSVLSESRESPGQIVQRLECWY